MRNTIVAEDTRVLVEMSGVWNATTNADVDKNNEADEQGDGVCYKCEFLHPDRRSSSHHSFFFSSMDTPPGPRATTSSRPPMTDVVWKKSYLRKSCMGL